MMEQHWKLRIWLLVYILLGYNQKMESRMERKGLWYCLSLLIGLAACDAHHVPDCAAELQSVKLLQSARLDSMGLIQARLDDTIAQIQVRQHKLQDSIDALSAKAAAHTQLLGLGRPARNGAIRDLDTTKLKNRR